MIKQAIDRLAYLCEKITPSLTEIEEDDFSFKTSPEKWSKKEILGHLIDSATNNHQRFVRGQFESNPNIFYDQNKWNAFSYYQQMPKEHLINFWTVYNQHILNLIKRIPDDNLSNTCTMKDGAECSIEFLINDYVVHLEHHLHQIIDYK